MTDYTRILKNILGKKKWTQGDFVYTFTDIVFHDDYYTFFVDVNQTKDGSFIAWNIYEFIETLTNSAFDILDVENTAIDIKVRYFGKNELDGTNLKLKQIYISQKNTDKLLDVFNGFPIIGKTPEGKLFKGNATSVSSIVEPTVYSIQFIFNVPYSSVEKYGMTKKEAQDGIMVDVINNAMSKTLLKMFENQFLTSEGQDWALLARVRIV